MKSLHVLSLCSSLVVVLLFAPRVVHPETLSSSSRKTRQAPAYPVWLLGEDVGYKGQYVTWSTGCDTTNVVALTEDRMHVDYFSTVETIREVRINLELPAKQVAIRMINDTEQDEVFVATHFGHMSINRFGYYKTFPIPIQYPLWLFMIEDLACVAYENFSDSSTENGNGNMSRSDSRTGEWNRNGNVNTSDSNTSHKSEDTTSNASGGSVVCVNVKTRKSKKCSDDIGQYFKSQFYTTDPSIKQQRAYVIEQSDSGSSIVHEFQVKQDCLEHVRDLKISNRDHVHRLWNSYDGDSVFLDDGSVLKESDFSVQGKMKPNSTSSQSDEFHWISQLYVDEDLTLGDAETGQDHSRPVMALDLQDKVYTFSWPDLINTKVYTLPIPVRKGLKFKLFKSHDVHYCYRTSLAYAMVEYTEVTSGDVRLGVAFVLSV